MENSIQNRWLAGILVLFTIVVFAQDAAHDFQWNGMTLGLIFEGNVSTAQKQSIYCDITNIFSRVPVESEFYVYSPNHRRYGNATGGIDYAKQKQFRPTDFGVGEYREENGVKRLVVSEEMCARYVEAVNRTNEWKTCVSNLNAFVTYVRAVPG